MSWSLQYASKADFESDTRSYCSPATLSQPENEQLQAARLAAKSLIDSGAVGDASRDFVVGIYGHANPGHAPTPLYANDTVTVGVSQKAAPTAPETIQAPAT